MEWFSVWVYCIVLYDFGAKRRWRQCMKEWELESYKSEREQIEKKIEGLRLRLIEVEKILELADFVTFARRHPIPESSILAVPGLCRCSPIADFCGCSYDEEDLEY